ncbi:hypothetical protein MgSA37_01803 [Mucilaginibacter gotjawali]|uniref:Uncharacterized protein n=2 Tax=Mucilaginibacter gotjawali TaxID=1550579 RepID=A0A0X8X4W5_9SPHI|nr:putative membrane protein [Mucilaginibacter gotjawali]BAU53634.1 hypothetical protein MgSA37_01803 [Mucilaginibacter gotjawali]
MEEKKKKDNTMLIVLINIVVLIIYTIVLKSLMKGDYDILALFAVIGTHFVICIITSIFYKTKAFLLSAAIIFLVGFSTCVYVFNR